MAHHKRRIERPIVLLDVAGPAGQETRDIIGTVLGGAIELALVALGPLLLLLGVAAGCSRWSDELGFLVVTSLLRLVHLLQIVEYLRALLLVSLKLFYSNSNQI